MRTLVEGITHWDAVFLTRIIRLEGRKLFSTVIPVISHSGDGHIYPLLPLFIYFINPDKGLHFLYAGLVAFLLELPLYKLMKHLIKRDRPCEALPAVPSRIAASDQFSFPSGHTGGAFVMAALLAHFFPLLMIPAAVWALLVGFSRIYLGVHYPSDILAGMFLGLFCAYCSLQLIG
jgi:undecaprenyl-diphosphatase